MTAIQRKSAIWTGFSLIIMALAAIYATQGVHSRIFVENDPQTTFSNLRTMMNLYRSGLAAWTVVFITDLIVTWGVYFYFRDSNRLLAQLTAFLRFVYTLILGMAIIQLFRMDSAEPRTILSHLASFEKIWSMGLIVFGFHLLSLGYLSYTSGQQPRYLGILLAISGISYIITHGGFQLFPEQTQITRQIETVLMLPMALGEMIFAFRMAGRIFWK